MGFLVSARYHYIEKYPDAQLSYREVEHELEHLNKREKLAGLMAVGSLVVSMLTLAGVLGGGAFILGALFAIAVFSATYAYCCRTAETGLRDKQANWFVGGPQKQLVDPEAGQRVQKQEGADWGQGLLGYFSGK